MKYFNVILFTAFLLNSCNKNENASEAASNDTTATEITMNNTPPMNYGDESRTYVSDDGKLKFRVLSEDLQTETVIIKYENTGKVFEMKQTSAASGAKYVDEKDNFFWLKGEELLFGKGEEKYLKIGIVK